MKMYTCKQVSTALGEKDYERMTPLEKVGLRIHVALCVVCGKYNRQVMDTHDMFRAYRKREEEGKDLPQTELEPEIAEQLKHALRTAPQD